MVAWKPCHATQTVGVFQGTCRWLASFRSIFIHFFDFGMVMVRRGLVFASFATVIAANECLAEDWPCQIMSSWVAGLSSARSWRIVVVGAPVRFPWAKPGAYAKTSWRHMFRLTRSAPRQAKIFVHRASLGFAIGGHNLNHWRSLRSMFFCFFVFIVCAVSQSHSSSLSLSSSC